MLIRHFVILSLLIFFIESVKIAKRKEDIIADSVEYALRASNLTKGPIIQNDPSKSSVHNLCSQSPLHNKLPRIGCCLPNDVHYIYNSMIVKGKLILFHGLNPKDKAEKSRFSLPPVKSVQMHKVQSFNIPIVNKFEEFSPKFCKKFYNGTLHVIGRSTAHNVYHAVGDNFAPLASQIVMDAFLAPQFLHLPRLALVGFQPGFTGVNENVGVLHLHLLRHLMTDGYTTVDQLDGTCFSRIAWGHGAHLLYYDTLVVLRRLVAEFSRKFVTQFFNLSTPQVFLRSNNSFRASTTIQTNGLHPMFDRLMKNGKPLNVVLFSRGNSGRGRSMQGEEKLFRKLQGAGANVILCCDFSKTSLEDQLSYAVHADVILGLHGAALVHGFFMNSGGVIIELKTLYGFTSALFAVVADSRQSTHAQVDIREYFVPGGHRPIDDRLADRTLQVLRQALSFHARGNVGQVQALPYKGDCLLGPAAVNGSLSHILGPPLADMETACKAMALHGFRDVIKASADDLHCAPCSPFVIE